MMKHYLAWLEENGEVFQQLKLTEQWKPITLCNGYEVSSFGRVRSENKMLSPGVNSSGYQVVKLWNGSRENPTYNKMHSVHRLVATHYLPNPDNLPVVMHLDNDRTNNHMWNLRWGTHADNNRQCVSDGRHIAWNTGTTYAFLSPDDEVVVCETSVREFCVSRGWHRNSLHAVVRGTRKHYKGWRLFASPVVL